MFNSADEVLSYIGSEGVEFVDVRFCDLPGMRLAALLIAPAASHRHPVTRVKHLGHGSETASA